MPCRGDECVAAPILMRIAWVLTIKHAMWRGKEGRNPPPVDLVLAGVNMIACDVVMVVYILALPVVLPFVCDSPFLSSGCWWWFDRSPPPVSQSHPTLRYPTPPTCAGRGC